MIRRSHLLTRDFWQEEVTGLISDMQRSRIYLLDFYLRYDEIPAFGSTSRHGAKDHDHILPVSE